MNLVKTKGNTESLARRLPACDFLPDDHGPRFLNYRVARHIDSLENVTTFEDASAVRGLLYRQPALLGLVLDALRLIGEALDFDDIVISVGRTTVGNTGSGTYLGVRVVSPLEVDEALEQLDRFDDRWLAHSFEVRQKLCVDIDFR